MSAYCASSKQDGQENIMAANEPWRPTVDTQTELNPFANSDGASSDGRKDSILDSPQIRDASIDTAPLQGSKDLSDEDSLDDVVAGAGGDALEPSIPARSPIPPERP
jgi:hypothetical protein